MQSQLGHWQLLCTRTSAHTSSTTTHSQTQVRLHPPQVFAGLLVGAMLPYWFSAMTMKSVGKAALAMVEEVRNQFNTIPGARPARPRPFRRPAHPAVVSPARSQLCTDLVPEAAARAALFPDGSSMAEMCPESS